MSYHIVRHIKVIDTKEKKEVWVKGADNNVFPKDFRYWHCESLSRILQEKGRKELDVTILQEYENGNFQGSNNSRYARALKMLYNNPLYENFDWRCGMGKEYDEVRKRRLNKDGYLTKEFKELLLTALNTPLPKEKFIITRRYPTGEFIYLYKRTKRYAKWTYEKSRAKVFRFKKECVRLASCYTNGNDWVIQEI